MEKSTSRSTKSTKEEDCGYYDGNFEPLDMDRTGQLAMECWNLRKTILDNNSQTLKQKQELKSNKNLIQNLQKLVHELQSDNLNKSKELVSIKTKYLDLEKKLHDQALTINCMNSSAIRSKRNTQYLQQKILEAQNEIKSTAIKHIEEIEQVRVDSRSYESSTALAIKQLSEERDRLNKENTSIKANYDESQGRASVLEGIVTELRDELFHQSEAHRQERETSDSAQEQAYEDLQSVLDDALAEKQYLARHAAERDHENRQLASYILTEGLHFPQISKLPPVPPNHQY